jgi:hypothetical protein
MGIALPEAYMLTEVDGGMLPNTWNAIQLRKYYAWCIWLINKDSMFSSYISWHFFIIFWSISKSGTSDSVTLTEGA